MPDEGAKHPHIVSELTVIAISLGAGMATGQAPHPTFRVIAIAEKGGVHQPFVDAARIWLAREDLFAREQHDDGRSSRGVDQRKLQGAKRVIFMGHHGELFQNSTFTTLFHNAILWAHQ